MKLEEDIKSGNAKGNCLSKKYSFIVNQLKKALLPFFITINKNTILQLFSVY